MPNPTDDVLIVGQLKDDALRNAVTDLVNFVDKETSSMATKFDSSLKTMQEAMKQFGVSQKVSVSLMKDAMKQYGMMFSEVWEQVNGGGGPKSPRDRDTLGGLKDEIKDAERMRDTLHLWSPEIQDANLRIAELRQELREATKTSGQRSVEIKRALAKEYSMQMSAASIMPDKEIKGAEAKLRRLLQIKNELRATPVFDEAKMQRLNNQITTTIQRVRELRNVSRVPTDVQGVLGMPIKTLDEIAAKMQAISNIRGGFELGSPELKRLNMEYERLSKLQTEYLGKNTMVEKSNNALARSFSYIRNRIVYAMTLGAATSFTKQVYEIRGQYELLERSLGVLVNSFQKGSRIFQELNEMAIKSPFTLIELGTAAKQLTAYNFATEEVVDTTRRLADISAALGVPMERLTYNLGQIRAQTVLTARDARDFANAGLPIAKALADYYTELEGRVVSTGDVFDRMSKKAVSYNDVMAVLYKMTDDGGKFFDFQAKQADTLRVQINNLTLAWNNMLNEIGKENQGLLTFPVQAMKELLQNWQTFNRILNDLIWTLGSAKVAQLLFNMALSKGNLEVIKSIAMLPQSTAANYQESLSKMNLTKVQARWLIAMDKGNVALRAAIVNMGILTTREAASAATANIFMGAWTRAWTTLGVVMQGLMKGIAMIYPALKGLLLNPATWFFAASMAITDLIADFQAAKDAANELNDTIKRRTEENSESIRKFTDDYSKSFAKLSSGELGQDEQVKLWEAVAEEIKKSTQNASQYIAKLEAIKDLAKRDKEGGDILSDVARIQDAVSAAQERELIEVRETIGIGGMWQHGLIEQLKDFTEELNDATEFAADDFEGFKDKWEKIRDVLNNPQSYEGGLDWAAHLSGDYKAFAEQMDVMTSSIKDSMERMWPTGVEKSAENIREFVTSITNSVKEANPEIKGQMERVFDMMTDNFIAMQAQTFGNITDNNEILIQGTYSAWETFFDKMKSIGGKEFGSLMDYVVSHGDYTNEKLQEIWKKASEAMQNEANESYLQIARLVDNLNSMKVMIPVMFQQQKQNLNELQKDFENTFITAGLSALPYEEYQKKLLENQRTYGKMQQKEGETTLAWNKRLNDMYNEQYANIAQQDKIMKSIKDSSSVIYQQAEKTKKDYQEQMKATEAVAKHEGFALELSKKNKGGSGRSRKDEDIIAEAFRQELSLIKDMQSNYEKLRKSGVDNITALDIASQGYEATLEKVNKTLSKYGITKFNAKDFLGKDVNDLLAKLEKQRADLVSTGNAKTSTIEAMDMKINELRIDAKTYNMNKVTEGLNNELGKLKDEYELAVTLDADPELGGMFLDMMGIDFDSLPHTIKEYADRYSTYLNKYLKKKGSTLQLTGNELQSLTSDDINSFKEQVYSGTLNKEWFDAIKKAYDDIGGKRRKDIEETEKWKNSLIEKYGGLQSQLTKIYKDSVKNQVNAVKSFGTEGQKSDVIRLQARLEMTDDPSELANINAKIASIVKDVTDNNPIALKIVESSENEAQSKVSKTYWENFKESELYSMTFTDMANNSTKAIQIIIDKLNELKDKVKEDPASMKALIKSLEDAENELLSRDPFGGIASSIGERIKATREQKEAQEELKQANIEVAGSEIALKNAQSVGDKVEIAKAEEKLAQAQQKQVAAQGKVVQSGNKAKKAQEQLKTSLQNLSNELGNVSGLLGSVSQIFRAVGDDDTADAIDSINEGFSIMTTVIMGVNAALLVLESSNPWLLAMAAALSVIVGLVSFLSGNSNKKITEQVEASERAVKRLEIAYIDLEQAVNKAYGAAVIGAQQAALANKKLQLDELKRQIELEKSRDSKNYDDDKILDLQKQYKELFYEIENGYRELIDNLMGTSSTDFAENLVSSMIDAFKSGEDYMAVFNEKFDEMIDNMIMKSIVSRVVSQYIDNIWDSLDERINERSRKESLEYANAQNELSSIRNMNDDEIRRVLWGDVLPSEKAWLSYIMQSGEEVNPSNYLELRMKSKEWEKQQVEDYRKAAEEMEKAAKERLDAASAFTDSDIDYVMGKFGDVMPELGEKLKNILGEYYKFGESSETQLSSLQQGIQGVTETTAGALEAYMNGVSQQVYYQSEILTQIRDIISGENSDIQLGVQGQMLLQLRESFQVQMAIQNILEGALIPSGQGFRVEIIN